MLPVGHKKAVKIIEYSIFIQPEHLGNLFQQHLKCCLPVKFVLCNFCMIKGDGSFVH